jgi:FdrA protein
MTSERHGRHGRLHHRVLAGSYFDSLVLMRLQGALSALPGVDEAAAMMATAANREILESGGLWPAGVEAARPDDLLVVVRSADEAAAEGALGRVGELLRERRETAGGAYRYRGLESALRDHPDAAWVAISVPGEHAAAVAGEALEAGRHVFLYSDNVALGDEVRLKRRAAEKGLLMLGPDCGTAIVGGLGLGFSNRLAPQGEPPGKWLAPGGGEASGKWLAPGQTTDGKEDTGDETAGSGDSGNRLAPSGTSSGEDERNWLAPSDRGFYEPGIGLVGASGTGLQAVSCRIDALGGRVSQVIGTGGRDLSREVGGMATLAGIDLLDRDPETAAIVVVSKPPAAEVASRVLGRALAARKPVVVCFVGGEAAPVVRGVHLVSGLDAAAERAVELVRGKAVGDDEGSSDGFVRGLFSGGTLALEVAAALRGWLAPLHTNLGLAGTVALDDARQSVGHSVVDLGADELTVGRPHPMIDPVPRDERVRREAAGPAVGLILVDVVLGDGAVADPAAGLAPAVEEALASARQAGWALEVVALVVGTLRDPQGLEEQAARLEVAGARVVYRVGAAVEAALRYAAGHVSAVSEAVSDPRPVPLSALGRPAVVNVGLAAFAAAIRQQGGDAVQVDWRPPAGGDRRLAAILERMKHQTAIAGEGTTR